MVIEEQHRPILLPLSWQISNVCFRTDYMYVGNLEVDLELCYPHVRNYLVFHFPQL